MSMEMVLKRLDMMMSGLRPHLSLTMPHMKASTS